MKTEDTPICSVCKKPMYFEFHHCDKWEEEVIEKMEWKQKVNIYLHRENAALREALKKGIDATTVKLFNEWLEIARKLIEP